MYYEYNLTIKLKLCFQISFILLGGHLITLFLRVVHSPRTRSHCQLCQRYGSEDAFQAVIKTGYLDIANGRNSKLRAPYQRNYLGHPTPSICGHLRFALATCPLAHFRCGSSNGTQIGLTHCHCITLNIGIGPC